MAKNTICHIEIGSTDIKECSEFYKELFGWNLNHDMGDDYIMFQPEGMPGGGFMKTEKSGGGSIVFYVEVDDIEGYLAKAAELGGKEVAPKSEIPNVGWFGQFSDPEGNIIGLFTARLS